MTENGQDVFVLQGDGGPVRFQIVRQQDGQVQWVWVRTSPRRRKRMYPQAARVYWRNLIDAGYTL